MVLQIRVPHVSMAAAALSALFLLSAGNSAEAVVYCKTVGIPQGCIVRPVAPVARAVVVAPIVVAPVVVAPRVGVGRVGVGAVGVGRVGVPGNRGGPVNRVGRR